MNASEGKDKKTGALKDFSIEKAWSFVKKNVRYFAAGALFVALVLILAQCMGPKDQKGTDGTEILTETSTNGNEYQVDAIPEINELITNYYAAYADGNIKELKKYATPITKNERSYIRMFSKYLEGYENIKCYTKPGIDEKSYLVSAYVEMKLKGIKTLAPGLDFFYVTTDDKGNLYIDNIYSQFNLNNKEKKLDAEIQALIDSFELESDVAGLQKEVQKKFEDAIASDEELNTMINTTIKDACGAWAQKVAQAQQSAEQETGQSTEQSTEKSTEQNTEQEPPKKEEEPKEQAEIVYATDTVNIRAEANENGALVDTVPLGTALTRTGTTADGWSKLEYKDKECYAKSDYLSTEKPAVPEEPQQSPSGVPEGTQVTLSNTVNVRSSMSETADKVGTAFAGETVTVVMSYAEGWTKVNWNGQTGYIKTEFLK